MAYKFRVGQNVVPAHLERERSDVYQVLRLLPELPNGERQYRIKGVASGVERVVREAEIKTA